MKTFFAHPSLRNVIHVCATSDLAAFEFCDGWRIPGAIEPNYMKTNWNRDTFSIKDASALCVHVWMFDTYECICVLFRRMSIYACIYVCMYAWLCRMFAYIHACCLHIHINMYISVWAPSLQLAHITQCGPSSECEVRMTSGSECGDIKAGTCTLLHITTWLMLGFALVLEKTSLLTCLCGTAHSCAT